MKHANIITINISLTLLIMLVGPVIRSWVSVCWVSIWRVSSCWVFSCWICVWFRCFIILTVQVFATHLREHRQQNNQNDQQTQTSHAKNIISLIQRTTSHIKHHGRNNTLPSNACPPEYSKASVISPIPNPLHVLVPKSPFNCLECPY